MRKIFLLLAISLLTISFVLAASSVDSGSDATQVGQGTGDGTQSNVETETQNQGEETNLQNQVKVQSGNYVNSNGEQMQIQNNGEFKLQVGNVEAKSSLEMTQEQEQNRTKLKTTLSNGKNVEIKVMPDTASERAIERLRLVNCVAEEGCTIELKEVGTGEEVKAVYEVKAEKNAKVLALFQTKMQVQAQIDAETGEVVQAKKPWWAFLASE